MPETPIPGAALDAIRRLGVRDESFATKREHKLRCLARQVAKEVLVDQPLPAAMLTRYVATVALAGIDDAGGRERVDWTNTLLRTIKLESELKKAEDPDNKAKDFSNFESMFRGSEALREIYAEESNGDEDEEEAEDQG